MLQYDAPQDADIAKAVLETLMGVFEVGEKVSPKTRELTTLREPGGVGTLMRNLLRLWVRWAAFEGRSGLEVPE